MTIQQQGNRVFATPTSKWFLFSKQTLPSLKVALVVWLDDQKRLDRVLDLVRPHKDSFAKISIVTNKSLDENPSDIEVVVVEPIGWEIGAAVQWLQKSLQKTDTTPDLIMLISAATTYYEMW